MMQTSPQQFTLSRPGMMSLPPVSSVSSAMARRNFKQQGNVLPSSLHAHQAQAILAEMQARPQMFSPSMHQYNPSLSHILRLGAMQGKLSSSAPRPSHWLAQSLIAARADQQRGALQNLGYPHESNYNFPAAGLDLLQSAVKATSVKAVTAPTKKSKKIPTSSSNGRKEDIVNEPTECDILCGRGGRSNHHPGNKRYRQVVSEMKASYKTIGSKAAKTGLSRAIVDHVYNYGGRFLKKLDGENGKYQVLSVIEGRKKTSQALREAKDVKWTV
jgi:hypothetical protein